MCEIYINSELKKLKKDTRLSDIVLEVSGAPEHVVVAVNGDVVAVDEYRDTILKDGDEVDMMTFVGGG